MITWSLFVFSVADDLHYEEATVIFVPEWANIMTTGGIFKKEESLRAAMEKEGKLDMDIRLFKIIKVQQLIREILHFRLAKGLL